MWQAGSQRSSCILKRQWTMISTTWKTPRCWATSSRRAMKVPVTSISTSQTKDKNLNPFKLSRSKRNPCFHLWSNLRLLSHKNIFSTLIRSKELPHLLINILRSLSFKKPQKIEVRKQVTTLTFKMIKTCTISHKHKRIIFFKAGVSSIVAEVLLKLRNRKSKWLKTLLRLKNKLPKILLRF